MIVSDVAGTTRDAIDNEFEFDHHLYTIIDTAGLRRKGKLDNLEKFALVRSEMAIKRSQFCILVIDISLPISDQDKNVAQLIYDANMPCIILANKTDLMPNFNKNKQNELTLTIKEAFKFLPYAQVLFISAKQHEVDLKQIINKMNLINDQLTRKIPQRLLQELIDKSQVVNQPPLFKGGRVELKKIEQVEGRMPTFVIKVNNVKYLHFSYMRYIENQIKEAFDFNMVPILVYYKDITSKERK
ncbi:50S ribosome-binding GTPase [bacterium]|nr:50S ribosome-binding GTPase [bacterium]